MSRTEVRILEVCDNPDCPIANDLGVEGWDVGRAVSAEAVERVERFAPALVVFHSAFPLALLTMCASLRVHSAVPIVVLSESNAESDAIACLRAGADAYLLEPIGFRELIARMRALMRRTLHLQAPIDVLTAGPVTLDRAGRHVWVRDRRIAMPRREFDILEMLMREAGRIVTRDALVRELWGAPRDTATLDVQVRRLRSRLLAEDGVSRIVTVRGVGYRFRAEVEIEEAAMGPGADVEIDLRGDVVEIDLRERRAGARPDGVERGAGAPSAPTASVGAQPS